MTVWETHVLLWIHSNASVGLQRIPLGFKFELGFLRILKLLHIYIFGILFLQFLYPYFISGQCSLFTLKYRSKESKHGPEVDSGTSFFLVQILKKLLYTWRMTWKFNWFYKPNLVMMGVGELSFQDGENWISILHCIIFFLLQKCFSIPSLLSFFTLLMKKHR